mmetsp:Transcript_71275/g.208942  ORF Transcript_71275/g.208942 Transcript_71275/m.208942 type:complete len:442 (+) Transcript_71275:286-1611(+)
MLLSTGPQHNSARPQPAELVMPFELFWHPVAERAPDVELVAVLRRQVVELPLGHAVIVDQNGPAAATVRARIQAGGFPLLDVVAVHCYLRRWCSCQPLLEDGGWVVVPSTPSRHDIPAPSLGMRIRAGKAEGRHSRVCAILKHGDGLRQQSAWEALQIYVRIQESQVDACGSLTARNLQNALDEAAEAAAALAVAHVGLGRSDTQRICSRRGVHHLSEGTDLDGVAQIRPHPVALEAVHLRGCQCALPQHGVQAFLLSRAVRRSDAGAPAVLVGLATGQAGNARAMLVKRLDSEARSPTTLTSSVAIRSVVEGERPSLVAKHTSRAEADKWTVEEHQVDAVHDRGCHLLGLRAFEVLLRHIDSHQRRGAGGVDVHADPFEVQRVREAVRHDGEGRGRGAEAAGQIQEPRSAHAHPVVLVDAHEVPYVLRFPRQAFPVPAAL